MTSPPIDNATATEMRRVDNSSACTVSPIKIALSYKGHLLTKDDGTYTTWARDFENELVMNGLWEYAFDPPLRPHETFEPRAYRNWAHNDRLACAFIATGVASSERQFISKEGAKACWLAIKGRHEGSGPVQQVRLLQEALSTKCSVDTPLTETIDSIFEKIDRAFAVGEVSSDTLKCIACLGSLSDKSFAHARSNISRDIAASTKAKPYKSTDIRRYLENEQTLINGDKADTTTATAFAAKPHTHRRTGTDLVCTECLARGRPAKGHTKEWCILEGGGQEGKTLDESRAARHAHYNARRNKAKSTSPSSKITVTPEGGKAYSIEGDAASIAAYIAAQTSSKPEFAGLASDDIPGDALAAAETLELDMWLAVGEEPKASVDWNEYTDVNNPDVALSSIAPLQQSQRTPLVSLVEHPFYLDTGATVHISPDASDFYSLRPIPARPIRGVGGSSIAAVGIGKIRLRVSRGAYIILEDALYVPKSTVRLISIGAMSDHSDTITAFDTADAKIYNKSSGAHVATATRLQTAGKRLYALDLQSAQAEHTFAAQHTPDLATWHRRLGHANYQSIIEMAKAGMVEGMPSSFPSKPPKCEHCILGKQSRKPVPKVREEGKGHRATRRLGIIWIDLTGESAVPSRTGNICVMNIVDDYTNKPWSVPLKRKNEAFPELKAWILARETETGLKVGIIRTGHDGELKSKESEAWFKERGIIQQFGAPYTSAHMGRVERMHRTLMGKARTMRIAAGCPPNLWDEFYLTATHLTGKTKTSSLKNATPDELWYEKKPDYSYIREIGCRAFVLILNKHNPKIYERSIECILVGYDRAAKTYRCYDKATGKVYSTYHVRFLESHDGHPPQPIPANLTSQPDDFPTIADVHNNAETEPSKNTQHDEPPLPDLEIPLQQIPEPAPEDEPPPHKPAERRTTRVTIPTAKANLDKPIETRTEKAVRESKEAGERVKEARAERKQALEDLRRAAEERPPDQNDDVRAADREFDQILAALISIDEHPDIDPTAMDSDEPKTWEEAQNLADADLWEAGYRDELKSLKEMGVYKLVPREEVPEGHKIHKGKPVFTLKRDENGKVTRHKVRVVLKGFNQVYGQDYTKTTSPTARMESWRILLHLAASFGWDAIQIDVKTAFLYGILPPEETIYMAQPKGFEEPGKELWVWKLERGLYGMKQAGRIWNKTLNDNMLKWGFTRLACESCVYYRKTDTGTVITAVHVDDFLSIASSKDENERFKAQLQEAWTVSDLGTPRHIVGIAVEWDRPNRSVRLSQTALIDKIISQFGQKDATPLSLPMEPGLKLRRIDRKTLPQEEQDSIEKIPYRSLVGCLLYLAISTRPDIQYAVQQLTQYLDCYSYIHWNAGIRLIRYLKGTRNLKLTLGGAGTTNLVGFTDSDWANCLDTRRSIGGYAWSLGSGLISWASRKQKTVAASSCEAEYMAAFDSAQECIWLRALLHAIKQPVHGPTTILCDNNATINLSEDPLLHSRVKHVDIKYHFLRERVASKELTIRYINTKDNVADLFTKALPLPQFSRLRNMLGLHHDSTRGGAHLR